jgi:Ca2+/Na+ antiporter
MLVPSLAGVVGSIVIPILGAVPDGMMVLFSGMKPEVAAAQEQVAVGIGALAGSTIMLLAATAFVAIVGGRVDIKNGQCAYKSRPKLTDGGLTSSGVEISGAVKQNAIIMLITTCSFLVIQIPALGVDTNNSSAPIGPESGAEHTYAGLGLLLCVVEFFGYCGLQYLRTQREGKTDIRQTQDTAGLVAQNGIMMYIEDYKQRLLEDGGDKEDPLRGVQLQPFAQDALKTFFRKYAGSDRSISVDEFANILRDINCPFTQGELEGMFKQVDTDKSGEISEKEFFEGFQLFVKKAQAQPRPSVDGEEGDEDEDDMPEEWKDLSPAEQQKRILMRANGLMGMGSLLVLIFSDPMCDVMSAMGALTGIPPFFVAFVLAPIASNASELISTFKFATKKTQSSITTSLSTVIGAACMNNTFCLGIFFGLIYFQGLAWRFTAETISMCTVIVIVGLIALTKKQLTLLEGLLILSLYPLSLVLVLWLEGMGFD